MASWSLLGVLSGPGFLTATAVAKVVNITGRIAKVEVITLHNTDTQTRTVRIWRAPNNGGSVRTVADDDQYQHYYITLTAKDTVTLRPGWLLNDANDTVQARADVLSKVTMSVDGLQYY